MLTAIIILYFREDEVFNVIGDDLKLSADKKIVTKTGSKNNWDNNAYGVIGIESINNNYIYEWRLKTNLNALRPLAVIGISSKQIPNLEVDEDKNGYHYAVLCEDGSKYLQGKSDWISYCNGIVDNDVVTLRLDLGRKEIRYLVNDKDQGIAYDDVKTGKDIKYRLFVSIYRDTDSIEILNFVKS